MLYVLYAHKDKHSKILSEIDSWTGGRTWIMATEAFCIFVVDAARLDRDGTFRKPIVNGDSENHHRSMIFCQKAKRWTTTGQGVPDSSVGVN